MYQTEKCERINCDGRNHGQDCYRSFLGETCCVYDYVHSMTDSFEEFNRDFLLAIQEADKRIELSDIERTINGEIGD